MALMWLWTILVLLQVSTGSSVRCTSCGWKARCGNSSCVCELSDFELHSNNRDCGNSTCKLKDCLECTSERKCSRCVNFIDESNHKCLDTCAGVSRIVEEGPIQGNLCNLTPVNESFWIGLGAGSACGIFFCVVVLLILWSCQTKKKKGHIDFVEETSKNTNVPNEKIRKIPVFDNKGYETEEAIVENNGIDEHLYRFELENMRGHKATLEELLIQVRTRLRAMDCEDTRVPTYKGVIHQLCRVLGLLNKETTCSPPADALGLLEWAKQMLNDYYELQQQDVSSPPELTRTPISSVDPIYAIPHDSCHLKNVSHNKRGSRSSSKGSSSPKVHIKKISLNGCTADSGYYSSVPVPYFKGNRPGSKPPLPLKRSRNNNNNNNHNNNNNGYCKKENSSNGFFGSNDVYTCTSSYSERSGKCMSTFIRDDFSNVSECSERSSSSAPDGLPFDMKDATEPIEV